METRYVFIIVLQMNKLQNKVAIITGGGKGIGKAIALRFAKEGAKIAIWERDTMQVEVAEEITSSGGLM